LGVGSPGRAKYRIWLALGISLGLVGRLTVKASGHVRTRELNWGRGEGVWWGGRSHVTTENDSPPDGTVCVKLQGRRRA
jgi:hypothetical protein